MTKRNFKMVIIGGSAGSLDIVLKILPSLTTTLNMPVLIVMHRKNSRDTILVDLLATRSALLVKEADEKEKFLPNVIYIAPADYHLLIEQDGSCSLDASEKINFSRPSIDVTFESGAAVFGKDLAGVLLSGANADGVKGLGAIKKQGGIVVVQDPQSAGVPYMPQQAINTLEVDLILTENNVSNLAQLIKNFESD